MESTGVLFIPVVAFLFCGFVLSCQSLDDKWKNYEKGMLARGIQVSRTPEWEKLQKQTANIFWGLALLFFIGAMVISLVEGKPKSSVGINGRALTMDDYNGCGPNPPMTCPPNIMNKYLRQ